MPDAQAALLAAVEEFAERVVRKFPQIEQAVLAPMLRREITLAFSALLDAALAEARAEQRQVDAERLRVLNNAWRMGDYRDAKTERVWNQAADDLMAVRAAILRGGEGNALSLRLNGSEAERDRLARELVGARKDTVRLDWIIRQGPPGANDHGLGLTEETWDSACGFAEAEEKSDQKAVRRLIDHCIDADLDAARTGGTDAQ